MSPRVLSPSTISPLALRARLQFQLRIMATTSRLVFLLRTKSAQAPSSFLRWRSWLSIALLGIILSFLRRTNILPPLSSSSPYSRPVQLTHGNSSVSVGEGVTLLDVVKSCPSLHGPNATYEPPWWLRSGDAQTMWNTIGDHTKTDVFRYERRHLRVPDNGTLVLDTYPDFDSVPGDTPIVVILHGITGSSQEAYSRATVNAVTKPKSKGGPGYRAVVLNFRGCDGSPVTSSRLYHAGETDDFRSVLLYLTHAWPKAPIYAVGFSMGASTLAVYLGQQGDNSPIKAAICVSNPWNWNEAAKWIEQGSFLNKYVYGPVLADALRTIYLRNIHAFPAQDWHINTPEVEAKKYFTIRWYDDRVTSKIFGFVDAEDYYTQTSSQQYISRIRVPTLSLHSLDDPIVSTHYLPWNEVEQSEHVVFASTVGGGHVGWFMNGEHGFLKRWYTEPIVEFFEQFQQIDPAPKPAPPMTEPDADGLVHQTDLEPGRVGFKPIQGGTFKGTGRSIQGF